MSEMFIGPIGEAAKKIAVLQEEIRKTKAGINKTDLKTASLKLFNDFPELEGIRWDQYTPHFNDGETCYFSVHEVRVSFKTEEAAIKYMTDPEEAVEGNYGWTSFKDDSEPLTRGISEFSEFIQDNEDLMESLFGDHSEITITSTGIEVSECDHD